MDILLVTSYGSLWISNYFNIKLNRLFLHWGRANTCQELTMGTGQDRDSLTFMHLMNIVQAYKQVNWHLATVKLFLVLYSCQIPRHTWPRKPWLNLIG